MESDPELGLRPEEKETLEAAILRTESHYFSRADGISPAPDLEALAADWLERAGRTG